MYLNTVHRDGRFSVDNVNEMRGDKYKPFSLPGPYRKNKLHCSQRPMCISDGWSHHIRRICPGQRSLGIHKRGTNSSRFGHMWKVAEKEDRCQEGGNHRMGLVIGRGDMSPRLIGSTDTRRQPMR